MNIRFISLGFCEKYDEDSQTEFCNSNQIKNYFGNTVFHFKIDNSQLADTKKENLQLMIQGGFFDPQTITTHFYSEKTKEFECEKLIERQPKFFALLIPYPILKFFSNNKTYGDEGWGGNCYPFNNMISSKNFERKSRFSDYRLKTDLTGEIKIINNRNWNELNNNFFDNNCYPLFVEEHSELIILLNDLSEFYKSFLGFSLELNNISKIVIPFFELSNEEAVGLGKSQSDNLPF